MAINYEELRKIELSEKRSAQLYKLPQDFYQDASNYLKNLQSSLESFKQSGDDSIHRKIPMLEDQIYNTRESIKNVYEMREKKIVALAISASRGVALDLNPLSIEEKPVYERMLELMRGAREELLFCRKNGMLSGTGTDAKPIRPEPKQAPAPQISPKDEPQIKFSAEDAPAAKVSVTVPAPAAPAAEPPIQKTAPAQTISVSACAADAPKPSAGTDYVTVRVMEELPPFVGNDGKKYALKKGDIASIHKVNASILEKHRKVEAIV